MSQYRITRRYICEDSFIIEAKNKKEALWLSGQYIDDMNTRVIKTTKVTASKVSKDSL